MRFRRVRGANGLQTQVDRAGSGWQSCPVPAALGGVVFDPAWELAVADRHLESTPHLLPGDILTLTLDSVGAVEHTVLARSA